MQIEPAQRQWLTQSVRIRFLQSRLEDFLPAAEAKYSCFRHLAAQTNRRVAFVARKFGELMSIFVAPRIMREQIFDRLDPEPAQRQNFRTRNPFEFVERLRNFHRLE